MKKGSVVFCLWNNKQTTIPEVLSALSDKRKAVRANMKTRITSVSKKRTISKELVHTPRRSIHFYLARQNSSPAEFARTKKIRPFSSWIPDPISHATYSLHWKSPPLLWPMLLWKQGEDATKSIHESKDIFDQKDRLRILVNRWNTLSSSSLTHHDWCEAQNLLSDTFGCTDDNRENITYSCSLDDQLRCQEEMIRDGFLLLQQMALTLEQNPLLRNHESYQQIPISILYSMMDSWTKLTLKHAEGHRFLKEKTTEYDAVDIQFADRRIIHRPLTVMKGMIHCFNTGLFRQPQADEISFWLEVLLKLTTTETKDYQETVKLSNWATTNQQLARHWTEGCLEYHLIALNRLRQPLQCEAALLKWQQFWNEDCSEYSKSVTTCHYNLVLKTWAEDDSVGYHSVKRIQFFLNQMDDSNVSTNIESYDALFLAFVKHVRRLLDCNHQINDIFESVKYKEEMENLFQELKKRANVDAAYSLTVDTFNCLVEMNAILADEKNIERVERSDALVQEMQTTYRLRPTLHTYISLMSGFAKTNRVEKIEELYQKTIRLYREGDASFCPTRQLHSIRIWAWSRAGNPEKTTACISEMHQQRNYVLLHDDFSPRTHDFNAIMSAWLRSQRGDEAAINALYLLKQMKRHHECGRYDCQPDVVTYNIAMATFNRYKAPGSSQTAMHILRRLEFRTKMEPQNDAARPSLETYKHVLVALIREFGEDDSTLGEIFNLLRVLSDQPSSFWPKNPHQIGMGFAWIKDEIVRSKLSNNEQERILSTIYDLERRVESYLDIKRIAKSSVGSQRRSFSSMRSFSTTAGAAQRVERRHADKRRSNQNIFFSSSMLGILGGTLTAILAAKCSSCESPTTECQSRRFPPAFVSRRYLHDDSTHSSNEAEQPNYVNTEGRRQRPTDCPMCQKYGSGPCGPLFCKSADYQSYSHQMINLGRCILPTFHFSSTHTNCRDMVGMYRRAPR